jgi:hypothetical protein
MSITLGLSTDRECQVVNCPQTAYATWDTTGRFPGQLRQVFLLCAPHLAKITDGAEFDSNRDHEIEWK